MSDTEATPLLPSGLAQHIVWHFDAQEGSHGAPLSKHNFGFSRATLQEAHAGMSRAFSATVQIKGLSVPEDGSQFAEPNIVLYCPYEDGQVVVDSMVEILAIGHEADVVILDPLSLCLGKYGIFGPGVETILENLYSSNRKESCPTRECAKCSQCLLDHIVNLPPSALSHGEARKQSNRRIIYLRDIGRIAEFFQPMLPYLLNAIRYRRNPTGAPKSDLKSADIHPTVLIFAMPEDAKKHSRLTRLKDPGNTIFPEFDRKVITSSEFPFELSYLSASCLLPPRVRCFHFKVIDCPPGASQAKTDLKTGCICLRIIPKNHKTLSFKSLLKDEAVSCDNRIWNTILAILLESRHATLQVDLSQPIRRPDSNSVTVGDPDEKKQNLDLLSASKELSKKVDVAVLQILDDVSCFAIGLASNDNQEETTQITNDHLFRAFDILVTTHNVRSRWAVWWEKQKEHSQGAEDRDENASGEAPSDDSDDDNDDVESYDTDDTDNDETPEKNKYDDDMQELRDSDSLNEHETRLLDCVVNRNQLETTFGDVCIPQYIIDTLRNVVSMPLLYPKAFQTGILKREALGGILLYGPPGTGKTMVCRALAKECGARMLQIKPSSVLDHFLGESEKSVAAVFSLARKIAPCIIFIDEIDALFRQRSSGDTWRRDILNETMQENKEAGIIVVGATNRPYDLDDAILRRLPSRMLIDAPGEEQRHAILCSHLRDESLAPDLDIATIAKRTQYYSGSDLKNLCVSAAMASVRELISQLADALKPENAGEKGKKTTPNTKAERKKQSCIEDSVWRSRTLKTSHMEIALREVPPSSSERSDTELYKWHRCFGRKED